MATWLKQSTAVDIAIGPFLDDVDGKTAETALTLSQADFRLKKNNGNWAQKNQASSATHEENGWYEASLDTTDTNTLGILIVAVAEAGALPVWREFLVVPANVWDSYLGSDFLQVDVAQYGNANGTFASGRPEVNTTLIEGSDATNQIAASILAAVVDGTRTLAELTRGFAAVLLGKASGLATTTATYRNIADTKDVVVATVDPDGNRSAVTRDLT
jgi:hypothetical protein